MNNNKEELTYGEKIIYNCDELNAEIFAEELLPLIGDCFEGEFTREKNVLNCTFGNNRKFKITVEESI